MRILDNKPPRTSCRELKIFEKLEILPVPALYIAQVLIFMKKYPQYFSDNKFHHHYETRNKNRMQLNHPHTKAYEKGLLYAGLSMFNKLPALLQNENCTKTFKKLIKKFLLEKSVYKLTEFMK